MIVLKDITKSYGEKTILQGFSQTFEDGTRYAILAPSGRGKTTLLRLILGLETPEAGTVTGVPERKAAVFQEDRLCRNLTVMGNLRMALGRNISQDAIAEVLSQLGILDAVNLPASQLSGGMARRVALARAILAQPELLVLDEPFTGLDEAAVRRCVDAILSHCPDATLLLVTHRPEDAEMLGIAKTLAL